MRLSEDLEGFDHYTVSVYTQELALQAGFGIRAFRLLRAAAAREDIYAAHAHAQSLLAAAAVTSLILWPGTDEERAQKRGSILRSELGIRDNSILRRRFMRNHLMHYDERLDAFLARAPAAFVDVNMIDDPPGTTPPRMRLRNVDHELVYSFRGSRIDLKALAEALVDLGARLEAGGWQNHYPARVLARSRITHLRQRATQ